MGWHGVWVERGMIVEMTPGLCTKHLDAAIERGGHGNKQAKERGVERGNIIEVDKLGAQSQELAKPVGCTDHYEESKEYEQMLIGEEVDELGYGIIGGNAFQHIVLVNPTERQLVAGHLYPYRIYRVGRYRSNICHNDGIALIDDYGVDGHLTQHLHGMLLNEHQGVCAHQEVVVLSVVVSGVERDGVELLCGQVPGIRRQLPLVITATEDEAQGARQHDPLATLEETG